MPNDKNEIDDAIDWKIIDQLYGAISTFSGASLDLKKMLIALVGVAVPIIVKLSDNRIDGSLFATLYLLIGTFWVLDAITYFYQEKLREKMNAKFIAIRNRRISPDAESCADGFVIENNRNGSKRVARSFFNWASAIYLGMLVLNTIALLFFCKGIIK